MKQRKPEKSSTYVLERRTTQNKINRDEYNFGLRNLKFVQRNHCTSNLLNRKNNYMPNEGLIERKCYLVWCINSDYPATTWLMRQQNLDIGGKIFISPLAFKARHYPEWVISFAKMDCMEGFYRYWCEQHQKLKTTR